MKEDLVHVGIHSHFQSIQPTINNRISSGRKALFGLLGTGLYGTSGLPIETSIHIFQTYIKPCTTYGLEALILSAKQYEELEKFQRYTLRSLLGLPDRTAIPAIHILTGVLPITSTLDQFQLTFLNSLILDGGRLKELVQRQYAIKGPHSKSWITHIKPILRKHSLPCIPDLIDKKILKSKWKEMVKTAILTVTSNKIKVNAMNFSTLKYLNNTFVRNKCHNVVKYIKNPREVRRACIKTQMITGTYCIQNMRSQFYTNTNATCQLCKEEDEDLTHCLLKCPSTKDKRHKYLNRVMDTIPHILPGLNNILNDYNLMTHFILDPTHPIVTKYISLPYYYIEDFERATRNLCFVIHSERCKKLEINV